MKLAVTQLIIENLDSADQYNGWCRHIFTVEFFGIISCRLRSQKYGVIYGVRVSAIEVGFHMVTVFRF